MPHEDKGGDIDVVERDQVDYELSQWHTAMFSSLKRQVTAPKTPHTIEIVSLILCPLNGNLYLSVG
jgi:hypothetical protein